MNENDLNENVLYGNDLFLNGRHYNSTYHNDIPINDYFIIDQPTYNVLIDDPDPSNKNNAFFSTSGAKFSRIIMMDNDMPQWTITGNFDNDWSTDRLIRPQIGPNDVFHGITTLVNRRYGSRNNHNADFGRQMTINVPRNSIDENRLQLVYRPPLLQNRSVVPVTEPILSIPKPLPKATYEDDISFIMSQTDCTRDQAIDTLENNKDDIVRALLSLDHTTTKKHIDHTNHIAVTNSLEELD